MGTSACIRFKDNDVEFSALYVQCDGYLRGVGADIKEALGGKQVVNGYSTDDQINGAGDMAVQLIAFLKHKATSNSYGVREDGKWGIVPKPVNTPGQYYLIPAGTADTESFEYVYTLVCPKIESYRSGGKLTLQVERGGVTVFDGFLDEFNPDLKEED